ncbi:uncharacterized protein EI97DRAFT_386577 [Westerdykella ornata]|uniref:CENP-V/GFA domain-containing protein n=1 Tax=Westerdykella ornata TaxID=318751 RepID=A0A6A6J7V1_WESOR|nr:uncharacterized protein EI97DRAFT_386577 [Westerdykella ornata]KAF2272078.1 hypothetical protein EI97DRAFT_386577 [Westerdykella ornata]
MPGAYETLHGSCACGRNRYVIQVPLEKAQLAEIRYDTSAASRNLAASPLIFWLRVPLPWYTSATFAQFPDETRTSIQRTFTFPFSANARHQFCGYCGTQLTSWNERTRDDAEHICVTVGSLLSEDQELLGKLGFLPSGDASEDETEEPAKLRTVIRSEPRVRGAPWFEELVERTHLGRIKQQRGGHSSRDGRVTVEWEVIEWTEGDDNEALGKRKLGEVEGSDRATRSA